MRKFLLLFSLIFVFVQVFSIETFAQKRKSKSISAQKSAKTQGKTTKTKAVVQMPKVTAVDTIALKNLLNRTSENAKPLLINFWATWCDPCREEFPDLVKIDADYRGKIDFITISLDDLEDINGAVPRFLAGMKAEMPAYLLNTDNEEAAIGSVSKDWQGGLPFTLLLNEKGEIVYNRQGKVVIETLRTEIEKLTSQP
ncbi:MAG: TlpA family protein disulfide reductase [Acidobacteriota bacterium]|nr:TlpA family protein disulfide reductase [Acidobacteriota bacterium]